LLVHLILQILEAHKTHLIRSKLNFSMSDVYTSTSQAPYAETVFWNSYCL